MSNDSAKRPINASDEDRIEVNLLTDLPVDKDSFGTHQRVADAIADVILNERDGGKALALEGGWGSGKSSVVKMLESALQAKGNHVCTFDAWAHEGDPLRRTFLESLIRTFQAKRLVDADKWNRHTELLAKRLRHTDTTTTRTIPALGKWFAVAALLVPPGSAFILSALNKGVTIDPSLPIAWIFVIGILLASSPLLVLGGNGVRHIYRRSRGKDTTPRDKAKLWAFMSGTEFADTQQNTTEAPEPTSIEFEKTFVELMGDAFPKDTTHKVVIVLDNLDRVPKGTAHTLWATIRLFAESIERNSSHAGHWTERLWLLVPYDREGARSIWNSPERGEIDPTDDDRGDGSDALDPEESHHPKPHNVSAAFLDKAFQVRFVVPPLHVADWEAYLKELIKKAMPTVGTDDELHRVYRLSERLADENGRPPSPRALKLYVNDIGALVRQFRISPDSKIRLDHLALYAILRRQEGFDAVSWVLGGRHQASQFASVMVGDSYVDALLAVHFGTDDFSRARTITLKIPLRQALLGGDGESLKTISASVPAFWTVAEIELPNLVNEAASKQEIIINIANAIEASDIASRATGPYKRVVSEFAQGILTKANWSMLSPESAEAAGVLLRLAAHREVTKATLDLLVSGGNEGTVRIENAGHWADGTIKLYSAVTLLKHPWHVSLSSDPNVAKKCLVALMNRRVPNELLASLECASKVSDLVNSIGPTKEAVWDEDGFSAIDGLLAAPLINTPWKTVLTSLSQRLQVEDVEATEADLLWNAWFDCHPKAPQHANKQLSDIVNAATFYPLAEQWAATPSVVAYMLAAVIFSKTVGRAVGASTEQAGYNVFDTIYQSADQHPEPVNEFVSLIFEYPYLKLLAATVEQRAALQKLAQSVIGSDAIRSRLGECLGVAEYFEHHPALSEMLGDALVDATQGAIKLKSWADTLEQREVTLEQADIHCTLVSAGALKLPGYRQKLTNALNQATVEDWKRAIIHAGPLYRLLVSALRESVPLPKAFADATEAVGVNLVSAQPPKVTWTTEPANWSEVAEQIDIDRRGTIANRIVDKLDQHSIAQFEKVIGLCADEFHRAFGKSTARDLVRKIAEPILGSKDLKNLKWLLAAARSSKEFWTKADNSDRGTFEQRLVEVYQTDEDAELRKVLDELADMLGITIPEPPPVVDDEVSESSETDEQSGDDT